MKLESNFFLADEIRSMADGKPMAMGLFPDQIVVLKLPEQYFSARASGELPSVGTDLSALVCIKNLPAGSYAPKVSLLCPNGEAHPQVQVDKLIVTAQDRQSVNVILMMKGLSLTEPGFYRMALGFEGFEAIEHVFEIRFEQEMAAPKT